MSETDRPDGQPAPDVAQTQDAPQDQNAANPVEPTLRADLAQGRADDPGTDVSEADQDRNQVATSDHVVGKPILSAGSADPRVVTLTEQLNALGYNVTIGDTVTPEVMQAVQAFRRDHDVRLEHDLNAFLGQHENFVGPETWHALGEAAEAA
jgi:peptidoglycan hydrolase-like protein with peptidoglycan-binding domain